MLADSFIRAENKLIEALKEVQTGINHKTGKGTAAEKIIEEQLLLRQLRPTLRCVKGCVVQASEPDAQSLEVDRIIYDLNDAPALIDTADHAVVPIEAVCGIVQITMSLDKEKLSNDLKAMAPIKEMRIRRITRQIDSIHAQRMTKSAMSPRCLIVGLPVSDRWQPDTIAGCLQSLQLELGGQTHVHGLYVIGIGLFSTVPIQSGPQPYNIRVWDGPDRLFRFRDLVRSAFATWRWLGQGETVDLEFYVPGLSREFIQ